MARPAESPGQQEPAAAGGPVRTCIGCRRRRPQSELARIVRDKGATLTVSRTLGGRGAWLCRASPRCLELAARSGGFARAFRAQVRSGEVDALCVAWPDGCQSPSSDFVPDPTGARD